MFLDSLARGGAPKGTLRSRFRGADLEGRVRAKTGHLSGVSALSGLGDSAGGEIFVFSILVNAPDGAAMGPAGRLQA